MKLLQTASILLLQLSLSYASSSYSPISNGLVAHYPFDGDTRDVVAGLYPAIKNGSTPLNNQFLSFNGTDDYLDISSANQLIENQQSFTLSYWVRTAPSSKVYSFLSKRNQCHLGDAFDMRGRNSVNFENLRPNHHGGMKIHLYEEGWQMITVTKDGDNYDFYHNAQHKVSKLFNNSAFNQGDLSFSNTPCIGVDGTQRFFGDIDDLRIYDRALNGDELALLYVATDPRSQYQTVPFLVNMSDKREGNTEGAESINSKNNNRDLYGEILISGEPIEYDLDDE